MAHRKNITGSVGQTAKPFALAILCAAFLCPLPSRAQQLPAQPNAVRQTLGQAGTKAAPPAPAPVQSAQTKPAARPKPAELPGAKAQKPANTAAPGTTANSAKPAQAAPGKPGPQTKVAATPAKPADANPANGAKPAQVAAAKPAEHPAAVAKRDPFSALLGVAKVAGPPPRLPPGIAGLVVASLRIDGIVSGPNGMIAIVANPQQRVYFLREGDRLYDGTVEHITLNTVAFHETGKDPFGKPVDREVSKALLNATPGETP